MAAELLGGLSAIKTALDLTQGLKNVHDTVTRDRAVMELQKEILTAQIAQTALVEEVSQLKKEVADFEAWGADKERYELKAVDVGAYAFVLKKEVQSVETPHWLCTTCYYRNKKRILQFFIQDERTHIYKCHECTTLVRVDWNVSPERDKRKAPTP